MMMKVGRCQFTYRTVLLIVTAACMGLAAWRACRIDPMDRRRALIREMEGSIGRAGTLSSLTGFGLVLEEACAVSGSGQYYVLVFDSAVKTIPGDNPVKIVVADGAYEMSTWRLVEGEDALTHAQVQLVGNRTIVELSFRNRFGGRVVRAYEVSPDRIVEVAARWAE